MTVARNASGARRARRPSGSSCTFRRPAAQVAHLALRGDRSSEIRVSALPSRRPSLKLELTRVATRERLGL